MDFPVKKCCGIKIKGIAFRLDTGVCDGVQKRGGPQLVGWVGGENKVDYGYIEF